MPVSGRGGLNGPVEGSIEIAVEKLGAMLEDGYGLSRRSVGILLLSDDAEIREIVGERQPAIAKQVDEIVSAAKARYGNPIEYEIALRRQEEVDRIVGRAVREREGVIDFREKLSRVMMTPLTGLPILAVILYFGLYKFVGNFGAGTVVNYIEKNIFEQNINPYMVKLFSAIIPWEVFRSLFVGEYGIFTLGLRYAIALILPIVTFFFIVFSILEDSGYLPRLAMLIDRVFKKIGLSGRAVIPMVLGFGCDTMATMVTRTLPTKRERIIATMLLALAVPCSAQLGVMMALLQNRPKAMVIWIGVVVLVFLFVGFLTSKLLPGEKPSFYMEVPPLRLPAVMNVLTKTYMRVKWYFKEIMPMFIIASVLIWFGQLVHLFDFLVSLLVSPVRAIGLPDVTAKAFLFGFFRRDYGAAGLYDLNSHKGLDGIQIVVACVALTLFLPCIAQFMMNVKERGWKMGVGISVFILFFSFSVAYVVNFALRAMSVTL